MIGKITTLCGVGVVILAIWIDVTWVKIAGTVLFSVLSGVGIVLGIAIEEYKK